VTYATLRYEVADAVATIALDEPGTRNALSEALLGELLAAFAVARDDEDVRCVVLASTHKTVFSAVAISRASRPTRRSSRARRPAFRACSSSSASSASR
jgi:enoyl-CoA hydratase/carnithine racemase